MSSLLGNSSKSKSQQNSVQNSVQNSLQSSMQGSVSNQDSVSNSVANSNSSSTSHTGNQAYDALSSALSPTVGQGTQATSFISQLLGLQGGDEGNNAFNKYLDSTGYKFNLDQGSAAITDNAAAKGLLNSGSTLKALQTYGQNTGASYFNNFLQQLLGVSGQGNQAASIISGAGGVSDSNSTTNSNSVSNTASNADSASYGTSNGVSSGVSNGVSSGNSMSNSGSGLSQIFRLF